MRSTPLDAPSMKEAVAAKRLLDESLEEAWGLQQSMLPDAPLQLPALEIRCKFRPARVVSGDFLDYFPIGSDSFDSRLLGLYLGDVVGKGIPAALYAALAMGTLRAAKKEGQTPAAVIEFFNRRLGDRHVLHRYCAVLYAVFDEAVRELRFTNAGLMPFPIHISEAGCCELGEGGLPCGLFSDVRYEVYTVKLQAGETVLFSTDGLIEATNQSGKPFGVNRLLEVCKQNRRESLEVLLDRVFQAVDTFAHTDDQWDDMTAAALRVL